MSLLCAWPVRSAWPAWPALGPFFPGRPSRCRGLGGLCLGSQLAVADPVRMALTAKVSAPAKPVLSIVADEPLQNLSIALGPAAPGGRRQTRRRVGRGQVHPEAHEGRAEGQLEPRQRQAGRDHWQGMISASPAASCGSAGASTPPWRAAWRSALTATITPSTWTSGAASSRSSSAPAGRGIIEVFADDGTKMGSGTATFAGEAPGTWLRVPWQGADRHRSRLGGPAPGPDPV